MFSCQNRKIRFFYQNSNIRNFTKIKKNRISTKIIKLWSHQKNKSSFQPKSQFFFCQNCKISFSANPTNNVSAKIIKLSFFSKAAIFFFKTAKLDYPTKTTNLFLPKKQNWAFSQIGKLNFKAKTEKMKISTKTIKLNYPANIKIKISRQNRKIKFSYQKLKWIHI